MRTILSDPTVDVPENVGIALKGHTVIVKGPRGPLRRDFNHINGGEVGGTGHHSHYLQSCTDHSQGVTQGFPYKMRSVYTHFPVNADI